MGTSKLVKKAHKASADDLSSAADIPDTLELKHLVFQLRVLHASELTETDRGDVWNLFEANMRTLTEPSSLGWNPTEKKEELFHRDSRFVLVLHDRASQDAVAVSVPERQTDLAAYTMFRFDHDQDENLLYCYELQVASDFRYSGLGRFLVERLTRIGKHWKMEKVMLTALKANSSARIFYAKVGFEMDPSSPDYESSGNEDGDHGDEAQEECDYEILSMEL